MSEPSHSYWRPPASARGGRATLRRLIHSLPGAGVLMRVLAHENLRAMEMETLASARGYWDRFARPCSPEAYRRALLREVSISVRVGGGEGALTGEQLASIVAQ